MKLLVIGAGGYGRLVKSIAELTGFDAVDFLDDNSPLSVGKTEQLEQIERGYDGSVVAIGNPEIREKLFRRLTKPVTIIHPTAVVYPTAAIGNGCVIEANAVVNSEAVVKDGVFVCAGAVVNHNACIHEFAQIDCNAAAACGSAVPKGLKVKSCTEFR